LAIFKPLSAQNTTKTIQNKKGEKGEREKKKNQKPRFYKRGFGFLFLF
jgi:hypothetical protein